MKSKKLITFLCACCMSFGLAGGVATSVNIGANVAFAEEQAKNVEFVNKVKKFSTYSAGALDMYLKPIWNTDEVIDESATVVTESGSTSLLYIPVENSVVIRDYHNQRYYVEGVDFSVDYKTGVITRIDTGELPYFELNEYVGTVAPAGGLLAGFDRDEALAQNDTDISASTTNDQILLYKDKLYLENHFNVSYRVNTSLTGQEAGVRSDKVAWDADFIDGDRVTNQTEPEIVSSQAGTMYSEFLKKLKFENEATIMFYGDSITYGCNASGFENGGGNYNPYMPRWTDLVSQWLSREYGANITTLNGAVPGWTTLEGVNYWQEAHPRSEMGQHGMAPADHLNETDLFVVAFGMNDGLGSTVTSEQYARNIEAVINEYIRARNKIGKESAVLLVSNMMPNTQSTWFDGGTRFHNEVESVLDGIASAYDILQDVNIAVAPVGGVFKTFEEKGKMTRNVLSNNMNHPTDFAVRVYAQTILQTLTGYADDVVEDGDTVIGNNNIIIGEGASVRMNTLALNGMDNSFLSGIRFRGYVNEKFFDSVGGNPHDKTDVVLNSRYKAGMWIAEKYILEATGVELTQLTDKGISDALYERFYNSAINSGKTADQADAIAKNTITSLLQQRGRDSDGDGVKDSFISDIPAVTWDDRKDDNQIDGYVRFNSALLNIDEDYFGKDLVARAYILDTQTGKYYVSRGWQCRNISEVASKELLTNVNLSADKIELLEWFVEKGLANTQLPSTFVYNGVEKSVAKPNSTYQCSCGATGMTATDLIGGKYCPNCAPLADTTPANWCSACNKVNCGVSHPLDWNIPVYHHADCDKYYTAAQLINGKYCPTCVTPATEEELPAGTKAVVALTKGDKFKLTKTGNDIMPMLMVKNSQGQWAQLNEVYGNFFSYNAETGEVTVIDMPQQGKLEISALVTLQSKSALNGDTGIVAEKTQEWAIELLNSTINEQRKSYMFSQHEVTVVNNAKAPLDLPTFKFDGVNTNYIKLEYSCSNADVVEEGGKLWLKGRGSLGVGTYTITVSAVAYNPIRHVVGTKQIKVNVVANTNYDHMILDTTSDQFHSHIANYGSYITYDETEQAYHYKTNTPNEQKVTLALGNRFTEKCNNGTWKYPYFLMDVKFNNENGAVLDAQRYDNTLAFDTFKGSTLFFTGNGTREQVLIFKTGDVSARALSYSEIVPNDWYTIAIPMSQYGLTVKSSQFTLFYGASEDGTAGATDMYFANLRFADSVGQSLEVESGNQMTVVPYATDFVNSNGTDTVFIASKGYQFTTKEGWNAQGGERSSFAGTTLTTMRNQLTSNKYISIDVYVESFNNIVFAQGIPGGAETYYALEGGFTINGVPVKQADIYLRSEINNADKERLTYQEMVRDTWYTIRMPISYPASVATSNYVFGVFVYEADAEPSEEHCTAWLNNLCLSSYTDVTLIGNDGTDFDMFTRFVSDKETVVSYDSNLKAYKLSSDGYVGLTNKAKTRLGNTTYTRMTMEFRLEDYITDMNNPWDENRKWLVNALFFNKMDTVIGLGESYENDKLVIDDIARVYDAEGNRVDLLNIQADVWYTIEILNPVVDWAFLGSTGTDIYFRNMVWYVGNMSGSSVGDGYTDAKNDNDVWNDTQGDYELWD